MGAPLGVVSLALHFYFVWTCIASWRGNAAVLGPPVVFREHGWRWTAWPCSDLGEGSNRACSARVRSRGGGICVAGRGA
ncbi:hypothetical protein B0J12DRAFT_638179 [Macrophomina phaseolina]|uniref:Secreted protein n=1 Tax=Macrophomina phaseolina TaxID=35725 RepID=A0ABQ8GUB3_9PEZI|nr:hypothetical protein B0J12DRAFT_638179 [Macrophomina phaseolina]